MKIRLLQKKEIASTENDLFYTNLTKVLEYYGYQLSKDDGEIIFLADYESLDEAINIKKKNKAPIILIHKRSEIIKSYLINQELIDYTIIFDDKEINAIYPSYKRSCIVKMPLSLMNEGGENIPNILYNDKKQIQLYINIGETCSESVLLKLIRVINQLTNYKIILYSSNKHLKNILNNNASIVGNHNIEQYIINSDIVVGSGYVSLYALLHNKPNITIGEKGYGGVAFENIDKQYNSFFQGRIGGTFGEYIPEKLFVKELEDISERLINNELGGIDTLQKHLHNIVKQNNETLVQTIENVRMKYDSINQIEIFTPLIFNSDYTIIKAPNKYWVRNRYTKQIQGWYNEEQYQVISQFIENDSTISKYLNGLKCAKEENVIFLKECIADKVLIPFID